MFGGIIVCIGKIYHSKSDPYTLYVLVDANGYVDDVCIGDSIAINGVCLTLIQKERTDDSKIQLWFQLSKETMSLTTFTDIQQSALTPLCHVERSIKHGDYMGGHYCSGHVNTTGTLCNWIHTGVKDTYDIYIKPKEWHSSLFVKNSVCINGVSLTIAEIVNDPQTAWTNHHLTLDCLPCFRISLIPHTFKNTTFSTLLSIPVKSQRVNIEFAQIPAIWSPVEKQETEKEKEEQTTNCLSDSFYMEEAFREGQKGRYSAPPNPWVGCVIVSNEGKIIGRGFHEKPGTPHAEVKAFEDADANNTTSNIFSQSTLFVTLEPCHHFGRTPPCDAAIIKRGIKRVVVATLDPDERVSGQGISLLKEHGVDVCVLDENDSLRKQIEDDFRSYFHHRKHGLPFCILKVGLSLDGYVCDFRGQSKWITCDESREDVHKLRAESQCVLVGQTTAISDKPSLNVRIESLKHIKPKRAVLDTHLSVFPEGPLFDPELGKTIVFCSHEALSKMDHFLKKLYEERKVTIFPVCVNIQQTQRNDKHLNLFQILSYLAKEEGVLQVLVEGGPTLHNSFLDSPFVSELKIYRSPKLLGCGEQSISWTNSLRTRPVHLNPVYKPKNVCLLGNDIVETYTNMETPFSELEQTIKHVESALTAFAKGEYVLVMDNEDRENEGDLLCRADMMTPEKMAFLLRHSTGIVCAAMTEERAKCLQLPLMVERRGNTDNFGTAFTISCDATNTTTGVSSTDRTNTVVALANGNASLLKRPGHIFPLIAKSRLLSEREGHTESGVALCKMAKFANPQLEPFEDVAVLSELQNHENGEMMRGKECKQFAQDHNILMVTVKQLKTVFEHYQISQTLEPILKKRKTEPLSQCQIHLHQTKTGNMDWKFYCFDSGDANNPHKVLVKNDPYSIANWTLRIHSECFTGDTLSSLHCDCGEQLRQSQEIINKRGKGIIIILAKHEGRGIGLVKKIEAYNLIQTQGLNTFEANKALGFKEDERCYDDVEGILEFFEIKKVCLLSSNPMKKRWLEEHGFKVLQTEDLKVETNAYSKNYMQTKADFFDSNK